MRAVACRRFGPPAVLELVELPDPIPGPGQVRVRVEAATVNPADVSFRAGEFASRLAEARSPYVAGLEFAGVVERPGEGAAWRVGERVMGTTRFFPDARGAHAELVVVDQRSIARAPAGMRAVEAATIPMNGLTARLALDRLDAAGPRTLAVTGAAGATGGYVTQLASRLGIRVIAISDARDEKLLRALGAADFVARADGAFATVRELTSGGADALVDAAVLGAAALPAVRDGGRFVSLRPFTGQLERGIEEELISVGTYVREQEKLDELRALAEAGALTPRVAQAFPAADAADAHAQLERGGVRGRLVLSLG